MSFVEFRLDAGLIIYDSAGGPESRTDEAKFEHGGSVRSPGREVALFSGDVGSRRVLEPELATIIRCRRAVKGKAYGFRWKDWGDFNLDRGDSRLTATALALTFQINKISAWGGLEEVRPIVKPVAATVRVWRNAIEVTSSMSVDLTKGRVTLAAWTLGDILECSCEFDLAVKFSSDKMSYIFIAMEGADKLYQLESMPIEEIDPSEVLQ